MSSTPHSRPIAVISDIHANRQALDAVLRAIREAGATTIWCLGDLTGYGADPEYCASTVMNRASRCLAGNHDLAITEQVSAEGFPDYVMDSVLWSRAALSPATRDRLAALTARDDSEPPQLVHASPRDPIWEYILGPEQALAILREDRTPLSFFGHTHLPAYWQMTPVGDLSGGFVSGEGEVSLTEGRWLINPGSVGQPRDGDARAAWLLYDPEAATVNFRRTPYDVSATQTAILRAGLPEVLATRLTDGR